MGGDYDSFQGVSLRKWKEDGKDRGVLCFNFINGSILAGRGRATGDIADKRRIRSEINTWWTEHCRKLNRKKKNRKVIAKKEKVINESHAASAPLLQSNDSSDRLIAIAADADEPFVSTGNSEGKLVSDQSAVHFWMKTDVELPEYTQLFIENGFDRMAMFENLSNEDLNLMGITKLGHRKKILSEVSKLKGNVSIEIPGAIPGAASSSSVSDVPPPAYYSEL